MRILSCLTLAALCLVAAPAPRAEASLPPDTLASFVKRVGARVDSTTGKLLVTSMPAGRGRVEIRLVNDATKERLGFYAYGFGNAKGAKDPAALYEYLLHANSELAIGSFFVDSDGDIGYKFFLSTRETMTYATFETVYLAMVGVIKDRGAAIVKMAGAAGEAPPAEGTEPTKHRKTSSDDTGDVGR